MKRMYITICMFVLVLSLTACGAKQTELVGDWMLVQGEPKFGSVLRFTKEGTLLFVPALQSTDSAINIDTALAQMLAYYEIEYYVKNKNTVELTIIVFSKALKIDVAYVHDGDILIFDDATYRRIS